MTRDQSWWLTTPFVRLFSLTLVGFLTNATAFVLDACASFTIISTMGWSDRLNVTQFIPVLICSITLWIIAFSVVGFGLAPSRSDKLEHQHSHRESMAKAGLLLFIYFIVRWSVLVLSVGSGISTVLYLGVCFDIIVAVMIGLGFCVGGIIRVCPGECVRCCGTCDEELASLRV